MTSPSSRERRVSSRLLPFLAASAAILLSLGPVGASGADGTLQGFVRDSVTSAPISGATVRIEASDLPWAFETVTDASGFYALAVPPHRYDLLVTGDAFLRNATIVAVGSSQATWANVSLAPAGARSAVLRGYVADGVSAAPVNVGRIVAGPPWWASGPAYVNESLLNASGYFEMGLVPGSYEVRTDGVIGYDPFTDYPVSLTAGQTLWYNISLAPDPVVAWINGTVRDADTSAAIAGAEIVARVDGLVLAPAVSNATGAYSLSVPAGSVELAADALGYTPLSTSAYVGGPGEYPMDLYLIPLSATVRGLVRDGVTGAPLPGVLVTADPLGSGTHFDQAATDASGSYDLRLPADDFRIGASTPGYAPWGTWAFLSPGQVLWANVTLWPMVSEVTGYLLDAADGSPLPGLTVAVVDLRSGYTAMVTADSNGLFAVAVPPSPMIIVAVTAAAPYAGAIAYLATSPYETTWANLTIERLGAQVRATVTDALTGLALPNVTVTVTWYFGSGWAASNASGVAVVGVPLGVDLGVYVWASGYRLWFTLLPPASGPMNVSVRLFPDLPDDVRVRGYVKEAGSGLAIDSAEVRTSDEDIFADYDYTDSSGYYELWIVPAPQTIRATASGYAAASAAVSPSSGETIWLNLTLPPDAIAPQILSFTANPSYDVRTTSPATLLGEVNETSLESATLSVLMLHTSSGGVGTFLSLRNLPAEDVSIEMTAPSTYAIASSWDTRTTVARLSDGGTSVWWPVVQTNTPYLGAVQGYWDNATVAPTPATILFDTRDGRLLLVSTVYGYIDPRDQPTSTFSPYSLSVRVDLSSEAVLGSLLVTGPSLRLGSLSASVSAIVPSGKYAILLDVWDSAGRNDQAAVLLDVAPDAVAPTAVAGADLTVDEDVPIAFDGSASSDNTGIVSYTWTFTDGSAQTLTGASASYTFATPGVFAVTLTVEDGAGNTATDTLTVTVRDVTAPAAAISSPGAGANLSGIATFVVSASDNVGVVRVELYLDGNLTSIDTVGPFEFPFDTRTLANGNHTFEIVAFDQAGNSASDAIQVTVYNRPATGAPAGDIGVLVFGGIGVLLAALGVILAWLVLRRRRPPAPATEPGREPIGHDPDMTEAPAVAGPGGGPSVPDDPVAQGPATDPPQ